MLLCPPPPPNKKKKNKKPEAVIIVVMGGMLGAHVRGIMLTRRVGELWEDGGEGSERAWAPPAGSDGSTCRVYQG